MIRKIDSHTCQVLHRRTSHNKMLEVIENIKSIRIEGLLETLDRVLNSKSEYSLDELAQVAPGQANAKLVMLVLIHTEFSYYKGSYRKKSTATDDAVTMLENVSNAMTEYLTLL